MAKRIAQSSFRFRSTDSIGAAGAEDDAEFLRECFVDTGALGIVSDITDNRLVVLGRTGAGKSALLNTLEATRRESVIRVRPEHLALTYVANSTVLNFFHQLGVVLDPFFKLLWRHVLTVEVLTKHLERRSEARATLLDWLRAQFIGASKHDHEMRKAIDYLEEWGKDFWLDTEFRVKEITTQVENKLDARARATLGNKIAAMGSSAAITDTFTESERSELVSRGQEVISQAQVQDLSKILKLLDTVLNDKQRCYYVVIDGLDENWVEERLRYKLIMALLQTARDFSAVRCVKVVIALRRDLLDRVFRLARDAGFQEEKFMSLYLPLVWNKSDILQILDRRVDRLVKRRYTSAQVTYKDLLPREFRHQSIGDYLYSMARRPRDVIAFFNNCIDAAADQPKLSARDLHRAEGEYSRGRLRALADEWSAEYPTLVDFSEVLQKRPFSFKLSVIDDSAITELCLGVASAHPASLGLLQQAMQVVEVALEPRAFKYTLARAFYQVGLVGLKLSSYSPTSWADELGKSVSRPEIGEATTLVVHPAYRRALGTVE